MMRIPYKGGGPAITALMGGEVQVAFPTIGAATPNLKSGKLRALAVTSERRSALAPDLPPIAASGLPGYDLDSADAVFGPAHMPAAIVNRLSQEIVRIVNKPEIKEKYLSTGSDVVGSTPQQLSAKIKAELAALGKIVKEANIRAE
jgi:tripartite-type tricarboxylate transporter receptor subunit TctC